MCLSSLLLIISKDIREKGCYTISLCAFTQNKLLATWFRTLSPLDFFLFLFKWCIFAEPQILQDLQKILFSVIPRSLYLLGSIFCLNWINVTIRKIWYHNSFFTQLLSFVFLPSAVLQSNHHQNLIEQCIIYRKMLVVCSFSIRSTALQNSFCQETELFWQTPPLCWSTRTATSQSSRKSPQSCVSSLNTTLTSLLTLACV